MKTIKYGILSTASIIGRFIQGVKESKYGEVKAICSRSIEKAKEKANEFDIEKIYDNYQNMLDDNDIDVIYIAHQMLYIIKTHWKLFVLINM